MFQTRLNISADRLDNQYNHLHHAEALKLLEQGRLHYLEYLGTPQAELIKQDCFLVLKSTTVEFFRELRAGEIICTCRLEQLVSDSEFTLSQELIKPPERLAVKAIFGLVAMSGKTRRRMSMPAAIIAKLRS